MTETMVERLPDWSATVNPDAPLDVAAFARAAAALARKPGHERALWVASYATQHGGPEHSIEHASALYVLLRVVYDLPESLPRHQAKVFGGWIHPSVSADSATFDLAWPVRVRGGRLQIERCRGYMMGRYDPVAEMQFFEGHFPLRPVGMLDSWGAAGGPAVS